MSTELCRRRYAMRRRDLSNRLIICQKRLGNLHATEQRGDLRAVRNANGLLTFSDGGALSAGKQRKRRGSGPCARGLVTVTRKDGEKTNYK